MMSIEPIRKEIASSHYPLGPNVAKYLGIDQTESRKANQLTDSEIERFNERFKHYARQIPVAERESLVSILEELVAMQCGELALKLHSFNHGLAADQDFRGLLALGNAAMLENELEAAKEWLHAANEIDANEIAPYVNLANIYFHEHKDELATDWALAGLKRERNNRRLWELMSLIYQVRYPHMEGEKLKELAHDFDSWAGVSLAALITDADDAMLRVEYLEEFYGQGERDSEFLIEYTAVLGTASQFAKIPLVVLQAERLSESPLPWQLYVHAAQAHLALERPQDAIGFCERANKISELSNSVRQHIAELTKEINLTLEKNKKIGE